MPAFLKAYLIISISLAILLSSCSTARQPLISATHDHIAYLSQPDDAKEKHLSILELSSLNSVSLDTGLPHDGCPSRSSDGKHIMFAFGDEYKLDERPILYKINVDDGNLSEVRYGKMPIGIGIGIVMLIGLPGHPIAENWPIE
jgi:hypothetical protein